VAANGRNGPVRSDSSGFERKLVRWCWIGMWDFPWDFLNGNRRVRVHIGNIPNVRWKIFENSSHMPFVDGPERYIEVVGSFLAEHD